METNGPIERKMGKKGGEMQQWKGGNSSWVSHSFLMQQITCIFS